VEAGCGGGGSVVEHMEEWSATWQNYDSWDGSRTDEILQGNVVCN
jgi:hypothetical protein